MKDVFAARTRAEFHTLVTDLAESLEGTFADCPLVCGWCAAARAADLDALLADVKAALLTPVAKKAAAYERAVGALTGAPLVTFHALAYRDVDAATQTHPAFAVMRERVAALSDADRAIFWQYADELASACLRATKTPLPRVPTPEEIAANIEKRRGQKESVARSSSSSMGGGIQHMWSALCEARGVKGVPLTPALQARLAEAECTDADLATKVPELGSDPYDPAALTLLRRVGNLCTMQSAIPSNMMQGIERVASGLVQGINAGTVDFASLNIEEIGQRVLNDVAEDDVGTFAGNLDKILPALQRMGT